MGRFTFSLKDAFAAVVLCGSAVGIAAVELVKRCSR